MKLIFSKTRSLAKQFSQNIEHTLYNKEVYIITFSVNIKCYFLCVIYIQEIRPYKDLNKQWIADIQAQCLNTWLHYDLLNTDYFYSLSLIRFIYVFPDHLHFIWNHYTLIRRRLVLSSDLRVIRPIIFKVNAQISYKTGSDVLSFCWLKE